MPKSRGAWIGLAGFVAVLLCVFSWFFVISPQLTATSEVEDQTSEIQAQNDVLAAKVAALAVEFGRIEEYQAELVALQRSLPTDEDGLSVLDVLTGLAEDHDVSLAVQNIDGPVSLLGDIRAAAEAQAQLEEAVQDALDESTSDSESAEPTAEPSTEATAEPEAPQGWAAATVDDLATVPTSLEIVGSYEGVRDFIRAVQANPERYLLVASPTVRLVEGTQGSEDAEATADSVVAELTIYSFVFTDRVSELAAALDPDAPAPEVGPTSNDNPFGARGD